MNSVTFKFWVTLEFSRRHGNLKTKRFHFISNTSQLIGPVHFIIWSSGRIKIGIKSSVAFLKCFSIFREEESLAIPNGQAIPNTPRFMIRTDNVALFHL